MKLTKNLLTRDEAFALAPEYVKYVENKQDIDWSLYDKVNGAMEKMKRGQACITGQGACGGKTVQYVKCKVSSVNNNCIQAIDGPVVRVSNGEYSWRVDGCDYAYPIKG